MLDVAERLPFATLAVQTQVELLDVLVAEQLLGLAVHDDLARFEDVAVLGDRQRHHGVLFDQQHRHALLIDVDDDVANLFDQHRGETERRFVENEEFGVGHERTADGEHLLLAARQVAGGLLAPLGQDGEEIHDPVVGLGGLGLVLHREATRR